MRTSILRLSAALALALVTEALMAQPAPLGSKPDADVSRDEAEARSYFERGRVHFTNQEFSEALAQFNASLEKMKSRSAMARLGINGARG